MDFAKRYKALNDAQKQAVDTIEGPVMVIAGPGTGKTELLSVRAANILRMTDTLPENILCLTFTDSGSTAMRERLVGIIGKDAYKVAIHTFHSFGSEVINQFGEFFYHGAHFRPADELSRHEIIRTIFDGLGHSNVLNKKMNGDYTYLSDSLTVISELKKSGLTSDELLVILDQNDEVIQKTEQLLAPVFAQRISKTTADMLLPHLDDIRASGTAMPLSTIVPLSIVVTDSLADAIEAAHTDSSTKPITQWRNHWFKKNDSGEFILKSHERQTKLRAISSIYEQYLTRMEEAELYDFDDMILRVVHGMEVFDELRFNLQEKYQYIMVDEFQDTNMAQMRIVHNLTNNVVHGDTPNIMVVGDDDQAIYSFQGADISNIINFQTNYPKAQVITLTSNYRSGQTILDGARSIIVQGGGRLEDHIKDLDKNLHAHTSAGPGAITLHEAETSADERHWLVESIKHDVSVGKKSYGDIAVLTRKHQEIEKLLPYFVRAGITVQYERRDNILELPPVLLLEQLAHVLVTMADGRHKEVNGPLAELLTHPAWGITPQSLWKLSLDAYTNRTHWIDTMATIPEFIKLQEWLIASALAIPHTPLEQMIDRLFGKPGTQLSDTEHDEDEENATVVQTDDFHSPLFGYFFSQAQRETKTDDYIRYLEALRTIRTKLREYDPLTTPTLETFVEFIALHRSIGSGITSVRGPAAHDDAVQLMTAHKSKGLEFDTVYVVNAIDSLWGERARGRNRLIGYPENLPIAPAGDSSDERLRLFYVAATRAKNVLNLSYSVLNDSNKATARASFLVSDELLPQAISSDHNISQVVETAEIRWYQPLIQMNDLSLLTILQPQLENYQLSVTHLTNFLDVGRGGPDNFLIQNLLRFPQAMSAASAYGSAIHKTLQRAHGHLAAHGKPQATEDILKNFEQCLEEQHLSEANFETYLQKGSEDLHVFLDSCYASFTTSQKTELNFKSQHVIVGEAHLTGALDLVDIKPDKTVTVTDYKTGKPALSWTGKTEFEKIKLHKYRQQLMFYKLLIENARDYRGHTVDTGVLQFVEPAQSGAIVNLRADFTRDEQERFALLINAVWNHIITLDLPGVSQYPTTLKGILAFEQELIDGTV